MPVLFAYATVFGGLWLLHNVKEWTVNYGPLGTLAAVWLLIFAVFGFVFVTRRRDDV